MKLKNCLLAICLIGANSPGLNAYPWHFPNLFQFQQDDYKDWLVPVAILGGSALMGYFGYKYLTSPTIKQIEVLDQQEPASCGYHALKNGILLYQALTAHAIADLQDESNFNNKDFFENLYRTCKPLTIEKRKINALQKHLNQVLTSYLVLPADGSEEIKQEYRNILSITLRWQ